MTIGGLASGVPVPWTLRRSIESLLSGISPDDVERWLRERGPGAGRREGGIQVQSGEAAGQPRVSAHDGRSMIA